jgi:hypothetical protein
MQDRKTKPKDDLIGDTTPRVRLAAMLSDLDMPVMLKMSVPLAQLLSAVLAERDEIAGVRLIRDVLDQALALTKSPNK